MNRKLHMISAATFAAALCMTAAPPLQAQEIAETDVTSQYLENASFESTPLIFGTDGVLNTEAVRIGTTGFIYEIPAWTNASVVENNAVQVATACYGTTPTEASSGLNNVNPPAEARTTESGTASLHMSAGWGDDAIYTQTVDLPAGTYKLIYHAYNANPDASTVAVNFFGYVPNNGAATYGKTLDFPYGEWTSEEITFVVNGTNGGKISIGATTSSGGSGAGAKLYVDDIQLYSISVPGYGQYEIPMQSLLANPSFEENQGDRQEEIPGWNKTGATSTEYCTRNNADGRIATYGEGNVYFQYWAGGALPDFSVTQTISDLPNGEYKIVAAADYSGEGFYLEANGQRTQIGTANDYSVTTTVEDNTLTLGVVMEEATGNFAKADNFRLYKTDCTLDDVISYMGASVAHSQASDAALNEAINALQELIMDSESTTEEKDSAAAVVAEALVNLVASEKEFAAFKEEVDILVSEAENYVEYPGYADYQKALEAAENAYANGSDNLESDLATLQAAEKACRMTNPTGDFTFMIENPNFDLDATGWISNTGAQNVGISSNKNTGTFATTLPHYENWNGSGVGIGTISQTITGLPNGKYKVSIDAFRDQEPASGAEIPADDTRAGIYAFANNYKTTVISSVPQTYTIEAIVTDGTLTIGIESAEVIARWIGFDNVKLQYMGDLNPVPEKPEASVIDANDVYYIYHPEAEKYLTNNADGSNAALYELGAVAENDAYKWNVTITPTTDTQAATISLQQLSSGKYLNALTTNSWSMGLGEYDATGSHYIVNDGEGTYTLSNLRNTNTVIGFDNLNDGSTPYYDKSTSNHPYLQFYKATEFDTYVAAQSYYEQKEALRERINTMRDLQDGILGGYHSEEDEKGFASILNLALEIYEQPEANVAIDSVKAVVTMADNAIEVYKYSTLATKDNPANFTFAIANADGEQASWHSIPGWTMEPAEIGNWGSKEVTNEVLTGNSIELWNPDGTPFTVSLTQSLAGLPNGVYSLDFGAFAADQSNSETTGELYFFAGSRKAAIQVSNPAGTDDEVVGAAQQYSIENIYVLDGTLDLGIRAEGSNSNWFGFDNVTLTYYGPKETLLVLTDSVTRSTEAGYDPTYVDNHNAEVCAFLGVDSLADEAIKISVITPEGQPVENTTDGWFGADGNLQAWGSDARVCVKYPADQFVLTEPEYFICTMPDVCQDGDVYTTQWGVMTATDTVIIRTVVTMVAPEIPDITKPEQCTNLGTVQITAEAEADATGANSQEVSLDVEEIAAFFEMDAATFSETTAFYATARDTFTLKPTANQGGYWLDANGEAISWGEGAVFYLEPVTAKDYSLFRIGQYGGACAAGDEYKANLYFVIGDEMVTVELTYTITGEATGIDEISDGAEVVSTEYYTLDGIQIDAPTEGIYIVTETYSDGTVKTYKKFVK